MASGLVGASGRRKLSLAHVGEARWGVLDDVAVLAPAGGLFHEDCESQPGRPACFGIADQGAAN